MASKRAQAEKAQADKERRYAQSVSALRNFPLIAIGVSVVCLMLLFLNFANIYNTNMNSGKGGNEIFYTGYQLFFAAISGSFDSPNEKLFGHISVYNYHTPAETQLSGILVLISVIFVVAIIGLSLWSFLGKKPIFNVVSAALFSAIFIMFTVCFIVIKTSPIMIKYQCNLKVCSLHSLAIIPAIVALIGAAVSCFASVKYFIARKILKA
ncbi:MAG: hypothetical protein J5911_03925 [Clostridia bacterium]|nr:hypothetical protein [Clostridia bacterium]